MVVLSFTALAHGAVEPWSIAIFELMLIGILLLWGIKITVDRRLDVNIPPAALPILALLLLGIVQSIAFTGGDGQRWSLSMDVEATRQTLTILFFLGFAFIVASNFLVTRERLLRLANALTIFGAALAAFALVQHFAWNGSFYWLRPTTQSVFGPFVNRNHFAGYMAMLMPVPLALILHVVRGHGRLLFGFAAALMGTAAIVSNSRSGVISLAGSMVFMMILNTVGAVGEAQARQRAASRNDRPHCRNRDIAGGHRPPLQRTIGPVVIVALAVIAGVLWIGAAEILEHFGDAVDQLVQSGTPDVGRATIWQGTLNAIRHHPVLGVGLGALVTVFPTYETVPSLLRINYAHNDYLQILAEAGAAGGIIVVWFIAVVLFGVYRGIRSRDPLRVAMALASGAGIIAILIQSVAETDLQIPSNALLFLVLAALASRIQEPEAALL